MKRFFKTGVMFLAALSFSSCARETIDARRGGIIKHDAQLRREHVADYMTYLKLTKGAAKVERESEGPGHKFFLVERATPGAGLVPVPVQRPLQRKNHAFNHFSGLRNHTFVFFAS